MNHWTIVKTIPTLAVPDLASGQAFYQRLGFEVDWVWPEAEPTHAGLRSGSTSLLLTQGAPTDRSDVYFVVTDVAACYASVLAGRCWELAAAAGALARRGDCPPARALGPPAEPAPTDFGFHDFSVVDPWGHHLTFGEVE